MGRERGLRRLGDETTDRVPAPGAAAPLPAAAPRIASTLASAAPADVPPAPRVVSLRGGAPISRAEWVRRILHEARLSPGAPEFEAGFARHLHRLLGEAGFHHIAQALLGAARDLTDHALPDRPGERDEYDALVDTGLALLVRSTEEE